MSHIFRTNGIVLSMRDYREADRYYSVFTEDHGKLELRARGSRKISSKLSSHLEPFAVCDLMVVRGRYNDIVAGVERLVSFPKLRQDAEKLLLATQAFYLVDIVTKPRQEDRFLFYELQSWMSVLDNAPALSPDRAAFLLAGFTLKLLALLGYHPEIEKCISCRASIALSKFRWHGLKGGVVCEGCVSRNSEEWFAARFVNDNALKLIRFSINESFQDLLHMRLPVDVTTEFHDLVESLVIAHFPVIPSLSIKSSVLA